MTRLSSVLVIVGLGVLLPGAGRTQAPQDRVTTLDAGPLLQLPANSFDLQRRTVRFVPTGGNTYTWQTLAGGYALAGQPIVAGTRLDLPFAFPFGGQSHTQVFANLNGNLSFSRAETAVWPERDPWPDATMRSMATAIDARAAADIERMIAPLWAVYQTGEIRAGMQGGAFVVSWDVIRPIPTTLYYQPLGRNVFQVRLFPSGQIEFSYDVVSEVDGIVGLYGGLGPTVTDLDTVNEPGDVADPLIDIQSVVISDVGTILKARFQMAGTVPATVPSGLLVYRWFVDTAGGSCTAELAITTSGRQPRLWGDCGERPGQVGVRVNGGTLEMLLPTLALRGQPAFSWSADVVWFGRPGGDAFDQANWGVTRPIAVTTAQRDLSGGGTSAGNLFEVFHYPVLTKSLERVMTEIYRRVPADDDMAVVFTDFRLDDLFNHGPGSGAINVPIHGIGNAARNPRAGTGYGSNRLQVTMSPLFVGGARLDAVPQPGFKNHGFAVNWIVHEGTHRWLADMRFRNPLNGQIESLADPFCGCHWDPWLNVPSRVTVWQRFADTQYPEHSPMGGAVIQELNDGTFVRQSPPANEAASGLAALDLYAMGLLPASEVPDTFLVRNPVSLGGNRYSGTKVPVRISDIVAAEGVRVPDASAAQRQFTGGVYLLKESGRAVDGAMLQRAEAIAAQLPWYFATATEGRMTLTIDAEGGPAPPLGFAVTSIVGNTVTVQWGHPTTGLAPTGFVLEGGVGPGEVMGSVPLAANVTSFTFAAPTGTFYLRMHTLAGGRRSAPSNEVRVLVNVPTPPAGPTNLLGQANGTDLWLSWTNSTSGGTAAGLILEVTGAATASVPLGASEQFAFSGVPPGTYTFSLRALNTAGASAPSNPVTLVFPGACSGSPQMPTALSVSRTGRQLSVSWQPPVSGPALSGYVLLVSGAFNGQLPLSTRSVGGTVGPGTYTFSVAASGPCGTSAATPAQTVVVQ